MKPFVTVVPLDTTTDGIAVVFSCHSGIDGTIKYFLTLTIYKQAAFCYIVFVITVKTKNVKLSDSIIAKRNNYK